MSDTVRIPEFGQPDRMRLSLREAQIKVGEMADYLGVTGSTVSTWINGRIRPNKQTLRLWALHTGVPLEWLETGMVRQQGLEPRTRCLTIRAAA